MKKKMKKLALSKETLRHLGSAKLAEAHGGTATVDTATGYDPISNQPEQCTGASCIPRNCTP